MHISEKDCFEHGFQAGRGAPLANQIIPDGTEMQNDFVYAGLIVGNLQVRTHPLKKTETHMIFFVILTSVLIAMTLFGYTFWGPIGHSGILLWMFYIQLSHFRETRKNIKYINHAKEHLTNARNIPFHQESIALLIIHLVENYPFTRKYVSGLRLSLVSSEPSLYWRRNGAYWLISIALPLYFSISIFAALLKGGNGWYNYLGIHWLGW